MFSACDLPFGSCDTSVLVLPLPSHTYRSTTGWWLYYCAMLRRAWLCGERLSVCPSIRLSVTFSYRDHIGWNTSKIISRPNSLRPLLGLTATWAI